MITTKKSLRARIASLVLLAPLTGCAGEASPSEPVEEGGNDDSGLETSQRVISKAEWTALEASIRERLDAQGPCPGSSGCESTTFTYEPPGITPGAQEHVVLVIDNGDSVAAGLRYKNQVLARYRLNDAGKLEEVRPSYTLPRAAGEIYEDLAVPGKIVPQALTQDLSSRFREKYYTSDWSPYHATHLNQVFNILVSYAPQAYYVLIDGSTVNEGGRDNLCNLGKSSAKSKVRARYESLATQIGNIVSKHHVDFISFSGGYAKEPLTQSGWFGCAMPADSDLNEFLKITSDYVKALSNYPSVTLVQAGVASGDPLVEGDTRAPSDCTYLPGRVRAGFFLAKDSGLGRLGIPVVEKDLTPYVPQALRNADACLDLYVNFGFEWDGFEGDPGETPMKSGALGLDWRFRSTIDPETSWAAPLLLAHLIQVHERSSAHPRGADLLNAARGGVSTRKRIDPLRNDKTDFFQFELK